MIKKTSHPFVQAPNTFFACSTIFLINETKLIVLHIIISYHLIQSAIPSSKLILNLLKLSPLVTLREDNVKQALLLTNHEITRYNTILRHLINVTKSCKMVPNHT